MSICPLLVAVEDAGLTYAEVRRLSWRDLDELIDLFETRCTPEQRRYLETNQLSLDMCVKGKRYGRGSLYCVAVLEKLRRLRPPGLQK
mgnify:CR=1 FL=1